MSFSSEFVELVRAGFSGIWLDTTEPEDAIAAVTKAADENGWNLFTWDLRDKLRCRTTTMSKLDDGNKMSAELAVKEASAAAPSGVLGEWPKLCRTLKSLGGSANNILVLPGWHRKDLCDNTLLQTHLQALVYDGRLVGNTWTIVVLGCTSEIPRELEHHFTTVRYSLPTETELRAIVDIVDDPDPAVARFAKLDEEQQRQVLSAARGLTRMQAENAFALSLLRRKQFEPDVIWDLKVQSVERAGMLKVYRGDAKISDVGGLEVLKSFTQRLLRHRKEDSRLFPKGLLLAGLPGTGKSQIVKSLGASVNRPVLMFDIGAAMGSLVGETEAGIRRALEIADAMQPCILMIDELEKALAGSQGDGSSDSGIMKRAVGTLLTYLNDHTTDVFVVGTVNDVSALPPEFTRAERFDAIFFVDLPSDAERAAIWRIWLSYYGLLPVEEALEVVIASLVARSQQWTGSEIRTACRLAALLQIPLSDSVSQVVPLFTTAQEKLISLQKWANGRCLSASYPGRYQTGKVAADTLIAVAPMRREVRPLPALPKKKRSQANGAD